MITDGVQDHRESLHRVARVDIAIDRAFQGSAAGVALSALSIRGRRCTAVGLQLIPYVGEGSRIIAAGQARRLEEHLDEVGADVAPSGSAKPGLA